MGKSQRTKGHSFERQIANLFGGRRNLEYQKNELQGIDVLTDRFIIQTKKYKKYCNPNKIEELPNVDGKVKLMITAGDRKPPIVCLYLDDFMEMIGNEPPALKINTVELDLEKIRQANFAPGKIVVANPKVVRAGALTEEEDE